MNAFKYFNKFAFAAVLTAAISVVSASAQTAPAAARMPRPSQKASVMQTVGITDITITYSRPGVKGRKIWGDAPTTATTGTGTLDDARAREKDAPIVPYSHVWRTGANEATTFVVTDDVTINGQKLAAGTYSLHTIPGKDEWTIIFNSDAGQWGSFAYDEKKDVLRVKSKPQTVADNQEWMNFSFPTVTPKSAEVWIRWEKVAVPFTVEVPNLDALLLTKTEAAIAANPTDWRNPLNLAGQFAAGEKWTEAIAWTDKSIKIKETFQNTATKSQYLYSAGRKDEAVTVGEKALTLGKAEKADTSRFEKRLADMKAGK